MPLTTTDVAPSEVVTGDAFRWRVAALGYASSDGFTARVLYIGAATSVEGTATADGTNWLVELTAALSATLPGGAVTWRLIATNGTDVATIATGVLRVIATPLLGAGNTSVSQAERTLALWKDRAEQQAGDLLQEYDLGGTRRVKRYMPQEITRQINYWTRQVAKERNSGRLPSVEMCFPPLRGLSTGTLT